MRLINLLNSDVNGKLRGESITTKGRCDVYTAPVLYLLTADTQTGECSLSIPCIRYEMWLTSLNHANIVPSLNYAIRIISKEEHYLQQ